MGDGCNMEGISTEAVSLAGHWGLGKLIALYDDNGISIDGHTDISFTEDVCKRYEALGWHIQHVKARALGGGECAFECGARVCAARGVLQQRLAARCDATAAAAHASQRDDPSPD